MAKANGARYHSVCMSNPLRRLCEFIVVDDSGMILYKAS
jgi:hypothetical protein